MGVGTGSSMYKFLFHTLSYQWKYVTLEPKGNLTTSLIRATTTISTPSSRSSTIPTDRTTIRLTYPTLNTVKMKNMPTRQYTYLNTQCEDFKTDGTSWRRFILNHLLISESRIKITYHPRCCRGTTKRYEMNMSFKYYRGCRGSIRIIDCPQCFDERSVGFFTVNWLWVILTTLSVGRCLMTLCTTSSTTTGRWTS